jgi:hypothetical protein
VRLAPHSIAKEVSVKAVECGVVDRGHCPLHRGRVVSVSTQEVLSVRNVGAGQPEVIRLSRRTMHAGR